ncbi:MAG: tripartite tricarboxylate transporter TctB family protein [Tagaea sp.]
MAGGPRARLWAGDAAVGLVLAAGGLVYWWMAQSLAPGTAAAPGPGAFPRFLGLAIAVAGTGCAARAWLARDAETVAWAEPRALASAAALAAACLAFETLGFLATFGAFLSFQFRLLSDLGTARALAAGAGATGALWLVFEYLLGVGLPAGPWGF